MTTLELKGVAEFEAAMERIKGEAEAAHHANPTAPKKITATETVILFPDGKEENESRIEVEIGDFKRAASLTLTLGAVS